MAFLAGADAVFITRPNNWLSTEGQRSMADILTADKILDTAEDVLRRYGPAKATVLDVARALGVSHGSVYRHFASKTALRDAVAQRWLARVSAPLAQLTAAPGP
ncbi:MAG TPA: TetR/AcrR family transcriptional regulator, partial [Pilimelia sp.]|nr:TetR/AcrR family transcriptional regulator [Pilimelia sp.]